MSEEPKEKPLPFTALPNERFDYPMKLPDEVFLFLNECASQQLKALHASGKPYAMITLVWGAMPKPDAQGNYPFGFLPITNITSRDDIIQALRLYANTLEAIGPMKGPV